MVTKAAAAKRPRADALRNRERVLATARELLSTEGMSVSFDEIARRVGVGVGTVYRHFPTRNALFEAVILGRIEEFTGRARALAATGTDPGATFLEYLAHLVGEVALNQALCEALESDAHAGFSVPEQTQQDFRDVLGTLLRRAQAAGEIRDDVDLAGVLDLVLGAASAERRARLRGSPNQLLAVILDGLRSPR